MSTNIRRQDNGVIIVEPHGKLVGPKIVEFRDVISPEIKLLTHRVSSSI